MINGNRLGDILSKAGLITEPQLQEALKEMDQRGTRLGRALVCLGFISEEGLANALSQQLGIELADVDIANPSEELLKLIPVSLAKKRAILPLERRNGHIVVAMADPLNLAVVDEISSRLSTPVLVAVAAEDRIEKAIERLYGAAKIPVADLSATVAPAVSRMIESVIRQGVKERASDIHFEPEEDFIRIRHRIDGVMLSAETHPKAVAGSMISRLKIMAGMDIAETRAPQDGGFRLKMDSNDVEFRVSSFPTIHGESVVLRILAHSDTPLGLAETGLDGLALAGFREAIESSWGLVVVTGPTGSGKTTTLYAAISALASPGKTIVSIEDPVERRLAFVRQTQVNLKAGLTFSKGLRSVLRQDPDIIMVGEIRDPETAETAAQAALTGHLVLSTMHTVDSASAVVRLLDLGVEPYKIASTLKLALAQRLVRKLCQSCKERTDGAGWNGPGCPSCKGAGYKGRTGIFEIIGSGEGIKELIMGRRPAHAIRDHAVNALGLETLRDDGYRKAEAGITSHQEVDRVTRNLR
ncbi:MAG: Flp pilus assembly complex ATPase component TadA [Nitrospinae bacterium]|nr:Flp pilus assembly complex ATPase component TadA [Nitrospinota bacterium]